jgi:hypothetical protein
MLRKHVVAVEAVGLVLSKQKKQLQQQLQKKQQLRQQKLPKLLKRMHNFLKIVFKKKPLQQLQRLFF